MAISKRKPEKSKKENTSFLAFTSTAKSTFRPLKKHKNPRWAELENHKMETLGYGNMREVVKLPEGEDLNEWFAVNIVDFYNQLSMLYGTITEFCTNETCPVMSAGDFMFYWSDGNKYPKPVSVSARNGHSIFCLSNRTIRPDTASMPTCSFGEESQSVSGFAAETGRKKIVDTRAGKNLIFIRVVLY